MTDVRIKRITLPAFTDADLTLKNPVLRKGEIVYIVNESTLEIENWKVGDGIRNYVTLPLKDAGVYPYGDIATVDIGDIEKGSTQAGRLMVDMMKDIISPYQAPVVSSVKNQANGVDFLATSQLEVGQSISTSVAFSFSVSNPSNLVATPMEVDSNGSFLESNPYPNASILLSPNGTLAPTSPIVYTIKVRAIHNNGNSEYSNTYIRFDSRFIWGSSALSALTTNQHALDLIASGGGQGVKQGYAGEEYEITANGYGYVLIPAFYSGIPIWTEVSNPNTPSSIGMINQGSLSVANGVGTYNYNVWRTPFSNTGSIKLKST